MKITITLTDDEGDETEHELPSRFEVCYRCEGVGSHLNPSIGDHAYTAEEFAEAFDDDESREQYFKRGGIYDVTCETCKGRNVVEVIDEARLTAEEKQIVERYHRQQAQHARWDAEDRATRRTENGYRD